MKQIYTTYNISYRQPLSVFLALLISIGISGCNQNSKSHLNSIKAKRTTASDLFVLEFTSGALTPMSKTYLSLNSTQPQPQRFGSRIDQSEKLGELH